MIRTLIATAALALIASTGATAAETQTTCYANNREPLLQKPYIELPLGSIKAKGGYSRCCNDRRTARRDTWTRSIQK